MCKLFLRNALCVQICNPTENKADLCTSCVCVGGEGFTVIKQVCTQWVYAVAGQVTGGCVQCLWPESSSPCKLTYAQIN